MPANNRVGLHEVHGISPFRQHSLHQDPEHAITVVDLRPIDGPFENGELVTERDVLPREPSTVFDQKADEESEVTESWHREIMLGVRIATTARTE